MRVIILIAVVICLTIGAQSVHAETEYQAGFKRGVSDAKIHDNSFDIPTPTLKAAKAEIDEHPPTFYQGWLDGFCNMTQHYVIYSAVINFDCSIDTSQAKSFFIAHPGFWTTNSSDIPWRYTQYHVYLYGSYPSSTGEAIRIVNEHLSACVDFSSVPDQKPYLCHKVSPSRIPQADDSVIDAGIFVVPRSLNASEARACILVNYHNMGGCGSPGGDDIGLYHSYLFYGSMDDLIYADASDMHSCADYYHLKEGTPKFDECMKAVS